MVSLRCPETSLIAGSRLTATTSSCWAARTRCRPTLCGFVSTSIRWCTTSTAPWPSALVAAQRGSPITRPRRQAPARFHCASSPTTLWCSKCPSRWRRARRRTCRVCSAQPTRTTWWPCPPVSRGLLSTSHVSWPCPPSSLPVPSD